MFASQYISNEIFPLKKCDDAETASMFMDDWKVSELPVVDKLKVMGFNISEKTTDSLPVINSKNINEYLIYLILI